MNVFGWDVSLSRKTATTISLDTLIRRLEAVYQTASGVAVTPETCMQAPTVQAIVNGISKGISSVPVHVYQKGMKDNRATKEVITSHPVEKLLAKPNEWQTRTDYWLDATSCLLRYGRYIAFLGRGQTGPIRRLVPMPPSAVELAQDDNYALTVKVHTATQGIKEYDFRQIHYARSGARNFLTGDSPVTDAREAIALEIAMEKYGATFFSSPMPGIIFELMEGFQAFKSDEEKRNFLAEFTRTFSDNRRFSAAMLPKGIKIGTSVQLDNDKAQMIDARKFQRTVIAGAFGVPPYMVGDLERQTFNNAEQQGINKVSEALLPVARIFEASMERDLLTDDDRASGVIIRFNLDGLLRGDFKTRQEGLQIQRQNGVINANDWRETENYNPISKEDGGDEYWRQGPSGQSAKPGQQQPPPTDGGQPRDAQV